MHRNFKKVEKVFPLVKRFGCVSRIMSIKHNCKVSFASMDYSNQPLYSLDISGMV